MKLKSLIVLCMKFYLQDDETGFNEDSLGNFLDNPNYKGALNNVVPAINRAIGRLVDSNKIMYHSIDFRLTDGKFDTSKYFLQHDTTTSLASVIGEVISFSGFTTYQLNLPVRVQQIDETVWHIDSPYTKDIRMFYFAKAPVFKFDPTGVKEDDREQDLKDYRITDTMCNYIIQYVKGELLESEGNSNSANFKNAFEDLISQLPDHRPLLQQLNKVHNVYKW